MQCLVHRRASGHLGRLAWGKKQVSRPCLTAIIHLESIQLRGGK